MKLERGMTDFHAHILPGADHGCASKDMCKKQLQLAAKYGVGTIVATSHFYPHIHIPEEFVLLRDRAFKSVETVAEEYGIEIIKGAEVQLCIGLDKMPGLEKLCIGDTNVMLVEIPDMPLPDEMYASLKRLGNKFDVVIAHIDRYTRPVAQTLIEEGYKMQINVESMFNIWKRNSVKRILDSSLVYALGSDIHGPDRRVYALMKKATSGFREHFEVINSRMDELLGR